MGAFLGLAAFSLKPLVNLEQRPEKACKVMAGHVIQRNALIRAEQASVVFQGSSDALDGRVHTRKFTGMATDQAKACGSEKS